MQLGGPIVVVWDNLNTHVSAVMAGLIAARDWLTVYQLAPYAHELNPVEPTWSDLKRSLVNLAKRNLAELAALVKTRIKRMQYRSGLLDGFFASTRMDLTPSHRCGAGAHQRAETTISCGVCTTVTTAWPW